MEQSSGPNHENSHAIMHERYMCVGLKTQEDRTSDMSDVRTICLSL
jgi:hypothetical protein